MREERISVSDCEWLDAEFTTSGDANGTAHVDMSTSGASSLSGAEEEYHLDKK